jgi:uncharacterized membrane protein
MSPETTNFLINGAIALTTTFLGYYFGRKKLIAFIHKTDAETHKTDAETELIRLDIAKEKLDLIEKLMIKIDKMQAQIDELQETIEKLEYEKCKGDLCEVRIAYNKILAKKEARKKYTIAKKAAKIEQ